MIHKNVLTDFSSRVCSPEIDPSAYVASLAAVIGNVSLGREVMVAPMASVRGDEGQPLFVGDRSNIQDGVIIHALETEHEGQPIRANRVEVDGRDYAVYIGQRVSLAHQAQVHGPALIEDDTFVGMKALVFKSRVGKGCVIEPGVILMGVQIPAGRYVPAGTVVTQQADADRMPAITADYPLKDLNKDVVHVNTALARGYNEALGRSD